MRLLAQLTLREQVLILAGGAILAVGVAFNFVLVPLSAANDRLEAEIAGYLQIEAAARIAAQRPAAAVVSDPATRVPLAARVTGSAERTGLPVLRLDPNGARIDVTVGEVDFATLLAWLTMLETDQALGPARIEIDRRTAPGQITARVTLEAM